jgi:hypothetical protein
VRLHTTCKSADHPAVDVVAALQNTHHPPVTAPESRTTCVSFCHAALHTGTCRLHKHRLQLSTATAPGPT